MFRIKVLNKNNNASTILVDSGSDRPIEFISEREAQDHISILEGRRLLPHSNIIMTVVPANAK